MTAPALAPIAPKLGPIICRLSTPHDGEKLACLAAIERLLAKEGLTFIDLADALTILPTPSGTAEPPSSPPEAELDLEEIAAALKSCPNLTDWEVRFVCSIAERLSRDASVSRKQAATLRHIYEERVE